MKSKILQIAAFVILLITVLRADAQIWLNPIFTDNMVIQRDKPVVFFGKATPGTKVTATFARESGKAVAGKDSLWKVVLPKLSASHTGRQAVIQGRSSKIILKNIVVGDLWLCIGQSNMEWPLKNESHYNKDHNYRNDNIRFLNPTYAGKSIFGTKYNDSLVQRLQQKQFYKGQWEVCDNNSIRDMSAVGYYFADAVYDKVKVPIGLINLSIGGAPLETFIRSGLMSTHPVFKEKVKGNWLYNASLPVWIRERGVQNVEGVPGVPSDALGPDHAYKPGYAFENGVEPITHIPIKGILCYQGESNAQEMDRVLEYPLLQKIMIADYRRLWGDALLPYYFVQLSSIDTLHYKGGLWPEFRDAQRISQLQISNSGMAVCSDMGAKNDVHPRNKKDVGERLARWALNGTYKQNILPSGPLPLSANYRDGKIVVRFRFVGQGLKTSDAAALRGFSIDGIHPATAIIRNNQVEIQTGKKPAYIYYGWEPFSTANLINADLLPASTFKINVN